MDLRVRLTLLLALIFAATLAVGIAYLLADERQAVLDELTASSDLAVTLLQSMAAAPDNAVSASALTALATRLTRDAGIRHLRFEVAAEGAAPVTSQRSRVHADRVPSWFAALVRPQPDELLHSVPYAHGRILIVAEPDDEIAEAWRESETIMMVLFVMCVGAIGLVFLFLGRALRPLALLAQALAGIERGQFATRVPAIGLADIDAITTRYNHMAAALAHSHAENRALAQRSLEIQELERRHLAHELHDEMGQSITAIKALAVSIRERLESSDAVLAERAATITDVSSDIYSRVRRMMARLHPVVLDELGLVAALASMVDDWNSHHQDCFCRFSASRELPALNAAARIGVYRIAQEALTNIARHAAASAASIDLRMAPASADEAMLELAVSDNGRGFDPRAQRRGLGLVGIQERVEALGGQLSLDSAVGAGLRLRARLPLAMLLERENDGG
jgi:two-component system sensor histidine kinase UhpB